MHTHQQPPATLEEAQLLLAQQAQELQRLHRGYETWMRVVAHDLRAPLRHVLSFAPLLRESVQELAEAAPHAQASAQDALEFATVMERSAHKMSAMLEGMAQVSRATRAELHMEVAEWRVLLHQVLDHLRHMHPEVQWQVHEQPALIMADVKWLKQAMQAVLDNAIKFSSKAAQPQVEITLGMPQPGWWRLQIQDNGVGFDPVYAQSLGELFQRMHREQEFAGEGCGLALLQVVAQRQGARWSIQAQPQGGCTVALDWPSPM